VTSKTPRIDRLAQRARRALAATTVSVALTVSGSAPDAWAQATATAGTPFDQASDKQKLEATQAYKAGVDALAKDPAAALAKFQESYGVVASPNTHLMIVRALTASERWLDAYHEAEVALEEAQAAAAKEDKYQTAVDGIEGELESIRSHIAFVSVKGDLPEDATLQIAGAEIDADARQRPVAVAPGAVVVVVSRSTGGITKTVQAAAGRTVEVNLSEPKPVAAPPPAPKAPPPEPEGGYSGPDRRILAMAAGGVGVLGFVGFGAFGLLANGQFSRLEKGCRPDPEFCNPKLESQASRGRTYQAVANAGLAIGIIGIAAGTGLFVWDILDPAGDRASADRRVRLDVGLGSLSAEGTF
jgi:hypothetical protein